MLNSKSYLSSSSSSVILAAFGVVGISNVVWVDNIKTVHLNGANFDGSLNTAYFSDLAHVVAGLENCPVDLVENNTGEILSSY